LLAVAEREQCGKLHPQEPAGFASGFQAYPEARESCEGQQQSAHQ
jgi:hypothetical protein